MPHSSNPSLQTPPDVGPGRKFSADGQPNRFEGCTVLCHIAPDSAAHRALRETQQLLRGAAVASDKLFWLPPDSLHVTILDVFNDFHVQAGAWPPGIQGGASMAALSLALGDRLRSGAPGLEPPLRLVPDLDALARRQASENLIVCGLQWKPADETEAQRLRSLRDRLAERAGFRHAGHEAYQFHTTLAYVIGWPDATETRAWEQALLQAAHHVARQVPLLELGAPEFCTFESMCRFDPLFRLGTQN